MAHQRKFQSVCTTSGGLTHCLFLVTPVVPLTEAGYKGWLMMGQGFPGSTSGKEPVCLMQETQETQVQSLGWENPLRGGHGNPLQQYSCLENPMDQGAWWATVHKVAKSQTGLT